MADILASVSVVLGAEISGFRAAMADARKELRGLIQFSEGLKDIGSSLTTYVSAPLAILGVAAVAASAKMEGLAKGLQAISTADLGKQGITGLTAVQIAAQRTGERLQELQVLAKAPGIGFEQAVQGDIRLRSVGISAAQSAKSLKEFANAIATTGGGASEFDRVTTQLAQLSAKGKVLSQDLRPIIEAAPAVSQALLKLYGTIDSESISASLAKQGKSSQDFIAILTDELAKLPRVSGGFKNALENLVQTGTQTLAQLGDGIIKALNLPALVDGLTSGIERIGNVFANLSPGVQRAVVVFGALVAATGPVLVAVGTLGAALPAITAGFATLGVTSLAALTPILPVAAAVAAAGLLIYENFDSITKFFKSDEAAQLFNGLAAAAQSAVAAISEAFSTLSANVGGNLGGMVTAGSVFREAFRTIAVTVTGALNVLAGTIKTITSLLTLDFSGAADGAKQAFFGLIDPIANLLGFTVKQTTATQGLIEKFDALAVVTPGLSNLLNKLSATTPFAVVDIASTARQLGLLETLKAKLKEVQEQRDKEVTVTAIKVDNTQIISLQKQIAALEGTTKKGTDAVAKLRLELSRLTALDNLLGNTPDQLQVLTRRADTLEKGLKTLVDAGVSTSSTAFRTLAQDFVNTSQAADKLVASISKVKPDGEQLELKPVQVKSLIKTTIGDDLPEDVARSLGDYAKQAKPFELPIAVKLNMQGIVESMQPVQLLSKDLVDLSNIKVKPDFTGLVPKELNAGLLEIGAGFKNVDDSAAVFGSSFDTLGAKAQVLGGALQKLLQAGLKPLDPGVKELGAQYRQLADSAALSAVATAGANSIISSTAAGIGEAIGNLVTGASSFGDAFQNLFGGILQSIGGFMSDFGKQLIAIGIGKIAIDSLFSGPQGGPLAIAAGVGLVALAGVVSAVGKSASSSLKSIGSGGGGGAASAPRTYNPPPAKPAPDVVSTNHTINLVAKGSALVGVVNIQTTRNGRTAGGH